MFKQSTLLFDMDKLNTHINLIITAITKRLKILYIIYYDREVEIENTLCEELYLYDRIYSLAYDTPNILDLNTYIWKSKDIICIMFTKDLHYIQTLVRVFERISYDLGIKYELDRVCETGDKQQAKDCLEFMINNI